MSLLRSTRNRGTVRPHFDVLEDRTVPTVTFTVSPGGVDGGFILEIKSNSDGDLINISDNGTGAVNNVTVGAFSPGQAISEIRVRGKAGNDRVNYNLTGNLAGVPGVGLPRLLDVRLGGGDDRFTANFGGFDLDAQARLEFQIRGEGGDDRASFNAAGVNVGADAFLLFDADGQGGDDRASLFYSGDQDGTLQLKLDGSGGEDRIRADVTIDAGSDGSGPPAAGALALGQVGTSAKVRGGGGKDTLRFSIVNNSAIGVFADIDGGGAKDFCAHTTNVTPSSCNTDSVLP